MRTNHESRIMSQAELFEKLGRKTAEDAIAAYWIRPRVEVSQGRGRPKKIYAVEDWRRVEDRILAGEYPK